MAFQPLTSFRFVIIDILDGSPKGTNSESIALSCAESEDFYVLDLKKGVWLAEGVNGIEENMIEELQAS